MSNIQILWVDDEIELLKPHILFLERKNYKVTTCTNGADAIDLVDEENFDIVFLDENMPGLTGLDTLAEIKQKRIERSKRIRAERKVAKDSKYIDEQVDDMYWMIDDRKFLIQGIDIIDQTTSLQLGLHTNTSGNNIISIEELINVPDDLDIGVFDSVTNTYYDIRQTSSFSINLPAGEYLSRFTLKFVNDNNLSIEDIENSTNLELSYINSIKSISIKNIGSQIIKSVEVYNINGQLITKYNDINATDHALIQTYNLITGNYVLILTTDLGKTSKKVTVR